LRQLAPVANSAKVPFRYCAKPGRAGERGRGRGEPSLAYACSVRNGRGFAPAGGGSRRKPLLPAPGRRKGLPAQSGGRGFSRRVFFNEVSFLVKSLCSFDAFVGPVGCLVLGRRAAETIRFSRRAKARFIFAYWERSLSHCMTISLPPPESLALSLSAIAVLSRFVRPHMSSSVRRSVTFVLTLFTFWPPLPPEREKLMRVELIIDLRSSVTFMAADIRSMVSAPEGLSRFPGYMLQGVLRQTVSAGKAVRRRRFR